MYILCSIEAFQGVHRRMVLVVNFFRIFEIIIFCFVVASLYLT